MFPRVLAMTLLSALMAGTALRAQSAYVVTTAADETVYTDLTILTDWVASAPALADIPEGVAQPGTAAMADIVAALERRVDAAGRLRLDTGALVALRDGDVVRIAVSLAASASDRPAPVIEIRKGLGIATLVGRPDLMVPSSL